MQTPDLTSFGYTPTESQAYLALLRAGPSSGYALAKRLSIARANAYQALHGLVAKDAAVVVDANPKIFRAVAPGALLARITREQTARLDRLEDAISEIRSEGEPTIVSFRGNAEFEALALRTAVRADDVTFLGPPELLLSLAPIWRARAANSRPTALYAVGAAPETMPFPLSASVPAPTVASRFGGVVGAILTNEAGIITKLDLAEPAGVWFSDPLLTGTLRAALAGLAP
jgi:DNA-binding MarR family transcriptional regulator